MVETYLLAHERPPTNPLAYSCVVIFLTALVPRFTLNICRLHDIGRSRIWTFILAVAFVSSLAVACALLGSFMNSGLTGKPDAPDDLGHLIYPVTLFMSSKEQFWGEMFTIAMVLDATGMKAINNLMAEVYSMNGAADVRRSNVNLRREIWESGPYQFDGGNYVCPDGVAFGHWFCTSVHSVFPVAPWQK